MLCIHIGLVKHVMLLSTLVKYICNTLSVSVSVCMCPSSRLYVSLDLSVSLGPVRVGPTQDVTLGLLLVVYSVIICV